MTPRRLLWLAAGAAAAAAIAGGYFLTPRRVVSDLRVSPRPFLDAPRAGLNLGLWTSWGDAQFSANILKNPGLESIQDRALLVAAAVNGPTLTDDTDWLRRDDHFWAGGHYSVRSGAAAGHDGRILDSLGLDVTLDAPLPLQPGDAVMLSASGRPPALHDWWLDARAPGSITPDASERRPGSPGERAVRLLALAAAPAQLTSFIDALPDRAGKLLPVNGPWTLSFWARCAQAPCPLRVSFRRLNAATPFLRRDLTPGPAWRHYQLPFVAADTGPAGILELAFFLETTTSAALLLDDVDLRKQADSGQPFRAELISTLEHLRPGFLRDWQGQLGDSLQNRLAGQFARHPSRYRPAAGDADTHYSLPDFLWLCRRIAARPWIVLPTTWNDAECGDFGAWLDSHTPEPFPEVVVEFGNENWNDIFRPAGLSRPATHAAVAARCFQRIRDRLKLPSAVRFVLNAPAYQTGRLSELIAAAPADVTIAVAPYYFYSLDPGLSPFARLAALESDVRSGPKDLREIVRSSNRDSAVYEVNLHTVEGAASPAERNPILAGAPAAAALLWRLLDGYETGAAAQCVYTLSQFDTTLSAAPGFAPIWGITRALADPPRLRPTGHALALLNSLLPGRIHHIPMPPSSGARGYAIQGTEGWSYLFISLSARERSWRLTLPTGAAPPVSATILTAHHFADTNEVDDLVSPAPLPFDREDGQLAFRLPPWSICTFTPARRSQ
ncbi:MAG: hypothetical protein IPP47_08705 [Bryobacterales bacterium]|nr:hypothetical protein [Bryobacterales bacterium]